MQTKVIHIGNSKGIRIPNHILKSLRISDEVDMVIDENKSEIILKPIRKPRENWELAFKKMNEANEDKLLIDDSIDLKSDQWEW